MGLRDLLGALDEVGAAPTEENAVSRKARKKGRWKAPPKSVRWSDAYKTTRGATLSSAKAAEEALGVVEAGETLVVISQGNWAMEHPIVHIASQLGPCDLWMATWAVNDDAVLRLSWAVGEGFIRNVRAVVDERMKTHRPAAMDILSTCGQIGIMACHAKFYVLRQVEAPNKAVSMLGSANWTQNPRTEAMVVLTDRQATDFLAGWVEEQLATGRARPYHHTGKLREELITNEKG